MPKTTLKRHDIGEDESKVLAFLIIEAWATGDTLDQIIGEVTEAESCTIDPKILKAAAERHAKLIYAVADDLEGLIARTLREHPEVF